MGRATLCERAAWVLGLAALGGCGGPGEGAGYVLLDAQARAAGIAIDVDGRQHEGAMPVEVDALSSVVTVRGPQGRARLNVEPGSLHEVRGPEGTQIARRLGEDVQLDQVLVQGAPLTLRT